MEELHGHVELAVAGARPGTTQPVPAQALPDGTFLILFSPGLVQGVAAGDVIRLSTREPGGFDVVRRGGNLSLQLFDPTQIRPVVEWLLPRLKPLSGRLDGSVQRGAVFTLPVAVGFRAIEELMAEAVKSFPNLEWYYGNVYDPDGHTPLNWWITG